LIADDDRDLVNILSVRCRRIGLKVLAAHDATAALALIRMRTPDVICLDVQMPTSDGHNLCETIASDESLDEIPIVIFTSQSDPDTVIRCNALCAYYVEKCPDIWHRLEPLLKELFEVPPAPAADETGCVSMTSTVGALSEAPSPVATAEADCDSGPQPCSPGPTPSADPLVETVIIPSTLVPTAIIQDAGPQLSSPGPRPSADFLADTANISSTPVPITIIPEEAEGPAVPSDSRAETEQDQAFETIEIESKPPAEGESLWRQLAHAVGLVMTQTVVPDEDNSPVIPAGPATEEAVSDDQTAASAAGENPVHPDLFALPKSTDAATQEAVPDRDPVPPALVDMDERVPCEASPHEVARLADLDKAWSTIGKDKAVRQSKIKPKKDVSISQQRKEDAEKTILIADDDGDLVQMLALRCTQMGLHVFRSPDAMHALLGAHRIHPDLIVLDVNMPGGNGLSVCEMLAADETLGKTPVIIMTGDASEEIQSRCRTFHAEYVLKGAGLWEQLEPVIRRALGLPASPPREKSSNGASGTDSGHRRPKILCIDDDPEISKILKFRLERYGVDVLRAFNGMQGYWTALDMRPDMIILDMVMPDGSGNYIFGRLRAHPLTEKVPVLMLTGVNTPGVRRQMFGLGVDAYLTKPLDFIALLEHVRQYVPLCDPQPATKLCEDADSHEGVTTEFLVAGLDQLVAK
jgi:DNA-binding response OmpR family regulator